MKIGSGWIVLCALAGCVDEPTRGAIAEIMQNQGTELQGVPLLGTQLQGKTFKGVQLAGATLAGAPLTHLHLEQGELVADQARGAALVNAHLVGQAQTAAGAIALIDYQITAIEAEPASYDPTMTGHTFLYSLSQNVDGSGTYQPVCGVDQDGRRAALALSAIWSASGARVESSALFTFGCTTGAVAKCYRWGYRPWVTGFGDLAMMHWTCTRLARADYCGTGTTHTQNGTLINVWDVLPAPGPIQPHGTTPPGMAFEAAWNTGGAVCLSHGRWTNNGPLLAHECPGRLKAPGLGIAGAAVCDTVAEARAQATAVMFNESNLSANGNGP